MAPEGTPMGAITVTMDELTARFDELVALAEAGTEVALQRADGSRVKLPLVPVNGRRPRAPGQQPGPLYMAPDFNDPLPDEFWLGDPLTDPLQNPDAFSTPMSQEPTP